MPLTFTDDERARLRLCRWIAFAAAPSAPALIAFSLIAVADKLGNHDRWWADDLFVANWCLATVLSAAAILRLHPIARGRWWKALAAFASAIPLYWLAFAVFAIAGMYVGLDM